MLSRFSLAPYKRVLNTKAMGDWGLEDKLLRSNIPGRFSTWEPDSDHEARSDSCEEEVASVDDNAAPEEPEAREIPEALRYGEAPAAAGRTGIKATLAQHRYFKKMQRAERLWNKVDRDAKLLQIACGVERAAPPPPRVVARDPDDRTDSESESDDSFLETYRKQRLAQLKTTQVKPTFGSYSSFVTQQEYLDALSREDVVVVVHLHEPNYGPCRKLNRVLGDLAAKRNDICFLGLALGEAGEALAGYDVETLPTLVVYYGGDVADSLFRVGYDMPPSYNAADVESLLETTVPVFAGDGPTAPPPPARPVCETRAGPPPRFD